VSAYDLCRCWWVESGTSYAAACWDLRTWELGNGKGKTGGWVECRGTHGDGVSKIFNFFLSNSWNRSGFIDFTEFGWFWLILLIFEFLTRFYMLYMCWLVKLYNFTSELVFLITMTCVIHPLRDVDGDYRSFACFGSRHLVFD